MTTANSITRDVFGALSKFNDEAIEASAKQLLRRAIASNKLDEEYIDFDRKRHGWALNYDFYDATPAAVLVQRRETHVTKYGRSPNKSYYIVRRCGRGVVVTEAPKMRVMRLAKAAQQLGEVIDVIEGRAKKSKKT